MTEAGSQLFLLRFLDVLLEEFRKARPARSRLPIGLEPMAGVVQVLLHLRKRRAALQVASIYLSYRRPCAVRGLQKRCPLPPLPSRVNPMQTMATSYWILNFTPQEEFVGQPQTLTKTGTIVLRCVRSVEEVKARGHSRSESSVRWFSKPAKNQRFLVKMPPVSLAYCTTAAQSLQAPLKERVGPRPPPVKSLS